MQFQTPLIAATLIRRYKRFLTDITLPDGVEVTAHCANPGAMTGLMDQGARIWVEQNHDPKRKLKFSWKLIELANTHWACLDTALPNKLVAEALREGKIPELRGYSNVRPEVKYGENSRIDFLLQEPSRPDTYVEVKAVTLQRAPGLAEFPDSVTKRGTKHLYELIEMTRQGHRAVMLYVVHRTDCGKLAIATDIDPDYAKAFAAAHRAGVEMICYGTNISTISVTLANGLPVTPIE
ncbi:MAG: DNA/RNA nuclease SfsA [Alphaproteobacteria bacterium]|nr:DNA/RNA nuclease SfsA [Alphaproteobacteria bacterium]